MERKEDGGGVTFTDEEKALARQPDAGPYCSDDYSEWWFPTDRWSWNLAQAEARDLAEESDSTAVYEGIENVQLHDHEDWEEGWCPEDKPPCPYRRSYRFEWRPSW